VSDTEAAHEIGTLVGQLRAWLAEVDPALLYEPPSPGEWTVMELLAHTVEFLRYWPPVMAAIAAEPGLSFGRGLDDSDRTGYVLAHGGDPLESMVEELSAAGEGAQATLAAIPVVGWEATGVHMGWGRVGTAPDRAARPHRSLGCTRRAGEGRLRHRLSPGRSVASKACQLAPVDAPRRSRWPC